ncbi:acyltransferase family protein, partial [Nocardia africana]
MLHMTDTAVSGLTNRQADRVHSASQPRDGFRPDIEGLRAVAVVAVALFHAGIPGCSGGFAGVDVFFVISGFLITGILWRDIRTGGTVELARFYGARARRLLPAAGIVVVATAIGAAVLLPPLQARQVLGDGIASALYVGNNRLALRGTDYLVANEPPSPFEHFWSLGVEEQFYLVWPVLIVASAWLVRRHRTGSAAPLPYLIVLAVVAVLSFTISLVWTGTLPPWAYFSLPARAWELAAGGLVALSVAVWSRLPRSVAAPAGWIGLVLVIVACTHFDSRTPYPGSAALMPVAGAALMIVSGCAGARFGVGRLLARGPVRAVGGLSYTWYLWHWPVLLLAPHMLGHPLGRVGAFGALVMAGGLALFTQWTVENPVRFAAPLRNSAVRSLACGGACTALAVSAALVLFALVPAPVGQGVAAPSLVLTAPRDSAAPATDPRDEAVRQLMTQAQSAVAASAEIRAVPSNLTPSLDNAPGNKADVFTNGCVRSWREVGQSECASGDPDSPTTVALVGDSHAAMWNPALEPIAQ